MGVDLFGGEEDWEKKLVDLAERGVLRAYILYCGEDLGAFGLGYADHGVFHFRATGYDQSLAALSPGTVLMYLVVGNLLDAGGVRRLCFCYGDAPYKRLFSNLHLETARIVLIRRTRKNDLFYYAHKGFWAAARRAKELVARYRPGSPCTPAAAGTACAAAGDRREPRLSAVPSRPPTNCSRALARRWS